MTTKSIAEPPAQRPNPNAFPHTIDVHGPCTDPLTGDKVALGTVLHHHDRGMTMRDYFAAKALAALIGHEGKDGNNCGGKAIMTLARYAYEYADCMLQVRATGETQA
jgi:hypothetical protein